MPNKKREVQKGVEHDGVLRVWLGLPGQWFRHTKELLMISPKPPAPGTM